MSYIQYYNLDVHVQKPRNEGWNSFLSFSAVSAFSQQTQSAVIKQFLGIPGGLDCETNLTRNTLFTMTMQEGIMHFKLLDVTVMP